jgi:hypothetical protein
VHRCDSRVHQYLVEGGRVEDVTKLEAELDKGPEANGFPDQTGTLARIKTVIGRRFHKSYTPQGVAALHPIRQVPRHVTTINAAVW